MLRKSSNSSMSLTVSLMNTKLVSCLLQLVISFLLFSYGKCHTIYIRPSADASCGFSEISGDPCFTWAGTSPAIVPPTTTFVFTSGYYTLQSAIVVSSIANFTMTGEPGARISCSYRVSYGTAFSLRNITNVNITNLVFSDCIGNQLSQIQSFLLMDSRLSHGAHQDKTSMTMEYTNASVVNTMFYGQVAHIRMNSLSHLEVNSSNFTSGYSDPRIYYPSGSVTRAYYNDGASISNYLPLSTITVRDCRFFNNRAFAQLHNVNNHYSRGGAIYSLGKVTAINTLFWANNASQGGAIYSEQKVTVINCNFTKNVGPGDYNNLGGAIFSLTDIVISNSTFLSNSARHGGATYSSTVVSTDSVFTNNSAMESSDNFPNVGNGGAVYVLHDVTAVNTSFHSNTATGGTGGAVYTEANYTEVYFDASLFNNNSAVSCGVVSVDRLYAVNMTMVNSTFSSNEASGTTDGGGVACFANGIVNTLNCVFNDNTATASNGGVFNMKNSSITIEESTFIGNMAPKGSGGVMYTNEYQTNYTIRHSHFERNSANDGGVMRIQSDSNVDIKIGTFIDNRATDKGGVFYIRGGSLMIDTDSTFYGNTASYGDVISTCLSSVLLNVSAYDGLEMQPDTQNPQYCSVYDEVGTTTSPPPTTEAISTATSTQSEITTRFTEATTMSSTVAMTSHVTTSNTDTTTPPEITSTESTTKASTAAPETTHTTQPEKITTHFTTKMTTTQPGDITTHSTIITFPSSTKDSSTTENNVDTNIPTTSSTKVTTNESNLPKTTTERGETDVGTMNSVTYISLAIGLVSLIVSVSVCVLMLLLFFKIWKKLNGGGSYRPVETMVVNVDHHEEEHTFGVEDSPSRFSDDNRLIPA